VEELSELPDDTKTEKIASGGYVTAALTSANDVYLWGRPDHPELLSEQLTGSPTPLDLDGQDFLDVAVGANHMVVLTTERKVFVVGAGGNGQLGSDEKQLNDWKEVCLPLIPGQRVAKVYAGYKNSFIIVEDAT
jgi:alpha-tubulin suppressor-like RCC1 family protein